MDLSVVELRQYTMVPGRRDVLIELFEREFVEGQEAVGMRLPGQFRDLDDPDRFVWFRGFGDMESRKAALTAFYHGPVWQAHRDAANATLLDNDDVLLLRPVTVSALGGADRPPVGATALPSSVVVATICHPSDDGFAAFFGERVEPCLAAAGARPVASFETEPAANTFPALPVRTENVFVWLTRFDSAEHHRAHVERVAGSPVLAELAARASVEQLRLGPTARSVLR